MMHAEVMADCYKYEGYTVEIYYDPEPDNPRSWDNLGTMVCWHRRYNLGDVDGRREYGSPDDFLRWLEEEDPRAVVLDLFLYDHSGLRIKVDSFEGLLPGGHAEFDTMQVGFIYVTRKAIRRAYGRKAVAPKLRAEIERRLRAEVNTYDDYLSGHVYGYVVKDPDGKVIDSLWGIYPDRTPGRDAFSYLRTAADAAIDYAKKNAAIAAGI